MVERETRAVLARAPLALAAASGLALSAVGAAAAPVARPSARLTASWTATRTAGGGRGWAIREPAYRLLVGASGDRLTIENAMATRRLVLPIAATVGRAQLPRSARLETTASGSTATVTVSSAAGLALVQAVVAAHPTFFTVRFSARLGSAPRRRPGFFTDGRTGLPMGSVTTGYSPDPGVRQPNTRTPETFLGVHHPLPNGPFAPPPYDVELSTPVGWLGIGLVQLPNARRLAVTAAGAVSVDYPLATIRQFADRGAGGRTAAPAGPVGQRGTWLRFPAFALTLAGGWEGGLRAYGAALRSLKAATAAAPPGARPSWWYWPIVDTWGQQWVTGEARTDEDFTAAWVRRYVDLWRQRFGIRHFTVVIDAQWQQSLGRSLPSTRFGGVAGMRRLIAELHAQGLRVLLWWPLWIKSSVKGQTPTWIDPTAAGYPAHLAAQIRQLVGTGPTGLGADGLKLDWGAMIPPDRTFADPTLGIGAAALYRYMALISRDAWAARPTAVIDGSAMAPQFGGLQDLLRLYDANSAETWSDRSTIVAAADPLQLVDGDGWEIVGPQAVPHMVQSAIFGTPAIYYVTRWSGGAPISPSTARALGALLRLTVTRGQGVARPYHVDVPAGDDWGYRQGSRLLARSIGGARAAVVYRYRAGCPLPRSAELVSVDPLQLAVPIPHGSTLARVAPAGTTVRTRSGAATLRARAGVRYTLTLRGCRP